MRARGGRIAWAAGCLLAALLVGGCGPEVLDHRVQEIAGRPVKVLGTESRVLESGEPVVVFAFRGDSEPEDLAARDAAYDAIWPWLRRNVEALEQPRLGEDGQLLRQRFDVVLLRCSWRIRRGWDYEGPEHQRVYRRDDQGRWSFTEDPELAVRTLAM